MTAVNLHIALANARRQASEQRGETVETDATISQLPPLTTGGTDTGSMTTPDGKTRSVARCMWQDHVAADFVKANALRKSGDLKGSFKTGLIAALKAIVATVVTVFGTIAAGVVFWKDAPKSWDRTKQVEVLTSDALSDTASSDGRDGEPSVSGSRTQPGLATVDEEDGVPGDEASLVGSPERPGTPANEADRAELVVVDSVGGDISGEAEAIAAARPDKKALKAAAKAEKAAQEAVERAGLSGTLLKEITGRAPSKLDVEQVKKQIAGSVGKMVKAYKEASKANAGKPNLDAHLGNVEATRIAKRVAAQLIGAAGSADEVLALHKALKEVAEDKGGSEKFVQLTRVIPGEHYPTTLADEVVRVVNEQGLTPALLTHMKNEIAKNYDGTPESARAVSENAMRNLRIAARRGIFSADQVPLVRGTLAQVFATASQKGLIDNLQTQDPKAAYAAFEASLNEAAGAGLLTNAEVQVIIENVQGNEEIQVAMVASAVRTIVAQPAADDEDLRAVVTGVAPDHLADDEGFVSAVTAQVNAIRAGQAELDAKALQFAEARRKKALSGALKTWRTNAADKRRQKEVAQQEESQRAALEAARVHSEEQAQLLGRFDELFGAVQAAQNDSQRKIEQLNGSLDRQDELNGTLAQIADANVRIPVVNIVQGVAQVTDEKSVHVTDALKEVNALRVLVLGQDSQIPAARRNGEWNKLMQKNGALAAALEAGTRYSATLQEVTALGETIEEQRAAVRSSLDAVLKLLTPYAAYHADNIEKLDEPARSQVAPRLEQLNGRLAAQMAIIERIGVAAEVEVPAVAVPSRKKAAFAALFGDDASSELFDADRLRANSVFVPAEKPVVSSRPGSPRLEVVLEQEGQLRTRTPVQQRPVPLDLQAVPFTVAQTPTVLWFGSQPVGPVVQPRARSLTSSPAGVDQPAFQPQVGTPVADRPAPRPLVVALLGKQPEVVDGDEDLLGSVDGDDESDDAGSDLNTPVNSRPVSRTGQPTDVVVPEDDRK